MSLRFDGVKYKGITVTGDAALETYDADLTPVDMQHGRIAYAKGKKIVGTGKAFEFAMYGLYQVKKIDDVNNEEIYGFKFKAKKGTNVILLSSTENGDVLLQKTHDSMIDENIPIIIGINATVSGNIIAYYSDGYLYIIIENILDKKTQVRIFYGKDNEA